MLILGVCWMKQHRKSEYLGVLCGNMKKKEECFLNEEMI